MASANAENTSMPAVARPLPRAAGFTLIELMIVVVIVAILAAIAMPSYQNHIRKAHRAAAESYLMDLAQRQQQYFIDNRAYAGDAATLGYTTTPPEVAPYYTITVTPDAGPPPTYALKATPTGDQANDSCGTLNINSAGAKSSSSGSNCW